MAPTHPRTHSRTHTHLLYFPSWLTSSHPLSHTLSLAHTLPLAGPPCVRTPAPQLVCVCKAMEACTVTRPTRAHASARAPPPRPCLCMLMQAPFTDTSTWYLARHFTQKNTRSPARSRANPRGRFVDPVSPPRLRLYHSCRHCCSYKCAFPHYRPCHFAAPIPP